MRGLFDALSPGMPNGRVRLRAPVYFCRHGETDWNVERRYQGRSDIPLNDKGRAQAAANGAALRAALGAGAPLVAIASPLSRAAETMEIMREAMGLPRRRYRIDDRLIEIDLGDWNGRTHDEISRDHPAEAALRAQRKWDYAPPGGESYAAASARVREFLLDLGGERPAPVLLVGHGASGRIVRAYLTGARRADAPHLPAPHDRVFHIARGREREIAPLR